MADAKLDITATFNAKDAIRSAMELEKEFQNLDSSTDKSAKSIAASFEEMEKNITNKINESKQQVRSLDAQIREHQKTMETLGKDAEKASYFGDVSAAEKMRTQLEAERKTIADLTEQYNVAKTALSGYESQFKSLSDDIEKTRAHVDVYKQSIKEVANAPDAAAKVAGQSFRDLGNQISASIDSIKARNIELNEQIATQKSAVSGLSASLKELKSQAGTPENTDRIAQTNAELRAERKTLKELVDEHIRSKAVLEDLNQVQKQYSTTVNEASGGQDMFRTRMLKLTEALRRLREQNLDTTGTYSKLESQLVKLKLTSKSIEKNLGALATPNAGLKATLDLGQGVTGVYTGLQSVTALLGEDNEELAKAFFKVQAALQTLNAVQMVANTIQKNSISNTVIRNALSKIFRSNTEKEALATVIASQALKTDTAVKVANTAATTTATTATKGFTAALLSNPVTAILTAVVALGTAIYLLASRTSEAEKAQKRLNEAQGEFFKDVTTETAKLELYVQRLSSAKEGTKGYYQAKKDLMDMAGKYNVSIQTENGRIKDLKGTYEQLADAIRDTALARAQENAIQKAGETYGKTTSDSYDKLLKNLTKLQIKFDKPVDQIINEIFADINQGNSLESILDEYFSFISETGLKTGYGKRIKSALEDIIEARDTFQDEVSKGTAQFSTKPIEKEISDLEEYEQRLSILQKEFKQIKIEDLWADESKKKYSPKAMALLKQIQEVQKVIQGYEISTVKQQESQANKVAEAQKKAAELQVQAQIDADKARLNAMEDGRDKRLKEIQNEYDQAIATINKNETALKAEYKKAGKTYTPAETALFSAQRTSAGTDRDRKTKKANEQYADEAKKLFSDLGYLYENDALTFMNEQQRKDNAFKLSLEKMRKDAKEKLAGGTITQQQFEAYNTAIDQAELNQLVEMYRTTEDQIKDIIESSNADIAKLRAAGREKEAKEAEKARDKAVSQVAADALQNSDDWINLFQNLDALSSKEIRRIIDHINEQLKNANLDPINLKAITDQLKEAERTASQKNPFSAVVSGFKAYKTAMEKAIKLRQEYNKTQKEEDKKAADQADIDALKEKSKAWGAVADAVSYTTATLDGVTSIASALGADEDTVNTLNNISSAIGGIGQAAVGFATGDIASGIAGVGQALTGIINLFNNDRKREKRIKNLQDEIDALTRSTEKLNKASEKTYSTKSANTIREQNKMLQRQQELIQKQIKEEEGKKNVDKDRIKDWKNDLDDINETIQDNTERIREAIAGISFDSFRDNFLDALTDMSIGSEEFAQEFDKMLQKSFYDNLLATKYDDQIRALYNRWAELGENGLTETEVERLRREQERLAEQIMADRDKYSEIFGWKNETEVNSMKGQISASVTEETFSKSLGIQRLQVDVLKGIQTESYKQTILQQSSLKVNTNMFSEILKIQSNTARTAANTEHLRAIEDTITSVDKRLRDIEQNTRTKYYGK